MAGNNKEAGSGLPGCDGNRTTDTDLVSSGAPEAQNYASFNSTSMNHASTRPAGFMEAGRAAVRAGLTGMPKNLCSDTARQIHSRTQGSSGVPSL